MKTVQEIKEETQDEVVVLNEDDELFINIVQVGEIKHMWKSEVKNFNNIINFKLYFDSGVPISPGYLFTDISAGIDDTQIKLPCTIEAL